MGLFGKPNIDKLKARGNVKGLINALKDESVYVRRDAAEALEKLGWNPGGATEKIDYLIAKQKWGDLAEFGELAVEPLLEAMENGSVVVQSAAAEVLGKIGEPSVEPLIQALKHEGGHYAAEALGIIGDARVVELLIEGLRKETSWLMRRAAADALGKIGDARAVEPLIQALDDEDRNVRWEAVRALGEIGDAKAEGPIRGWLLNPQRHSEWNPELDVYYADIAEEALRKIEAKKRQKC